MIIVLAAAVVVVEKSKSLLCSCKYVVGANVSRYEHCRFTVDNGSDRHWTHQSYDADVALQSHHAHSEGHASHGAVCTGRHRRPSVYHSALTHAVFILSAASGGRLCTWSHLCVSVCVQSVSVSKIFLKTNEYIFVIFTAATCYMLPWKWLTFGVDHFRDG